MAINTTMIGFKQLLKTAQWEFKIFLLHLLGMSKAGKWRSQTNLKLHLASGRKPKPGWINVDLNRSTDITLDLREPLPFDTNSCSIVYSEHFLEHLDYPDHTFPFLKEVHRVLQPGGMFRVGVPDTEWPLRSYINGDGEYSRVMQENKWHPEWCTTTMERINYHFRQGTEHRFAYDFETLKKALELSGFEQVERSEFDPAFDSADRSTGTLYATALKPARQLAQANAEMAAAQR